MLSLVQTVSHPSCPRSLSYIFTLPARRLLLLWSITAPPDGFKGCNASILNRPGIPQQNASGTPVQSSHLLSPTQLCFVQTSRRSNANMHSRRASSSIAKLSLLRRTPGAFYTSHGIGSFQPHGTSVRSPGLLRAARLCIPSRRTPAEARSFASRQLAASFLQELVTHSPSNGNRRRLILQSASTQSRIATDHAWAWTK